MDLRMRGTKLANKNAVRCLLFFRLDSQSISLDQYEHNTPSSTTSSRTFRTVTQLHPAEKSTMAELDASLLHTTVTDKPGQLPPAETLVFGQTFTDHMLQCKWSAARGWEPPVIKPFGDLSISPAASVLHYSTTLFEGEREGAPRECSTLCS